MADLQQMTFIYQSIDCGKDQSCNWA